MPSQRLRTVLLQVALVLLGEAINVTAFRALIIPARLLSGGVVGTAMLLNQQLNWPIGLQTILYNIPIFMLGYRYLGRRFVLLSMLGVVSFSILLDNLTIPVLTHDRLLTAIFGGVITGIADGLILRAGGSTGGFDILGLIVSKRFGISTGQVFLVFNGIIIALAAYFNDIELAMFTLIMLFASTRTIDGVLRTRPRPVALIISSKHEEIAARLLHDLGRGVTYLQGQGAYTAVDYRVLLCVISRFELVDLRQILNELDPKAFTVILDASDVIGQWERISPLSRLFD
jgi:uncharacterized membrane-anchored protein YitT (DUF2179 family)